MGYLKINKDKITPKIADRLVTLCPFKAIEYNGEISVNSACKMCRLCVNKGPKGAIEYIEDEVKSVDKSAWRGIAVFADAATGTLHPVTAELIGKARELAAVTGHPVYALLICGEDSGFSEQLLSLGVDKVYTYADEMFSRFAATTYTNAFEDFINTVHPSSVLVGATNIGRSLAPRVACRFGTGLTADCTRLEMKENTDLVQIRPAFGGNIMARILTPNTRPQFCTVRYKVFSAPTDKIEAKGEIVCCKINPEWCDERVLVTESEPKPAVTDISEADVIVAVGRGVKTNDDLARVERFAKRIGATLACSRPMVESGIMDASRQIGLSGKTVAPKLIITLGVSGSVQFTAGMKGAECIISVNSDRNAPIFDVAHYCVVGDLYEVLDRLEAMITGGGR